ncbi:MAG: tetratricopeptide repeat protein, partial [Planctomycetes bacterium]|nr:tetratricopeptide repeat protein [Planctomycetota bacterium]
YCRDKHIGFVPDGAPDIVVNHTAFNRNGESFFHLEFYRFADAVPWLRKAIDLDSDYFLARTDLGQALVHSGEEKEGRKVLEEAEKACDELARRYPDQIDAPVGDLSGG